MNNGKRLEPIPENWDTALAVVAPPDDLEYGAASAVARWTAQGKRITYLLLTRGEAGIDSIAPEEAGPLREAEQRRRPWNSSGQSIRCRKKQDRLVGIANQMWGGLLAMERTRQLKLLSLDHSFLPRKQFTALRTYNQ